jgi:hypothetical protein
LKDTLMKPSLLAFALAAALTATGAQAALPASLLVNGSFEAPGCSSSNGNCILDTPTEANYINGWTTALSGVEYFSAAAFGGAADGVMVVDLANYTYLAGGGIEQTFATVIGKAYDLAFSLSTMQWSGRDGTAHIDVTVAGNTTGYDVTNHTASLVWIKENLSFVATGANTTLRFTNTQNPYLHFAIVDGVSAVAAPVPEPETYALMLAGLGLVGFAARRRSIPAI